MPSELKKEINYKSNGLDIHLVIVKANAIRGMTRTLLASLAAKIDDKAEDGKSEREMGLADLATYLMGITIYPSAIAATEEQTGFDVWPPPFEQFCELPDELVQAWGDAAFALNPHWVPDGVSSDPKAPTKLPKKSKPRKRHLPSTSGSKPLSSETQTVKS